MSTLHVIEEPGSATVARDARTVGLFVLASRLAGLVRDALFSHLFGATHATDAFLAAFIVPNTVRTVVAEGSLSAAIVPTSMDVARSRGTAGVHELARLLLGIFPVVGVFLGAVLALWAEPVARLIAPGFAEVEGKIEACASLLRIMAPYIALSGFVAPAVGLLHGRRRFAPPSASPLLFNVVHMAAMVTLGVAWQPALLGVAMGVVAGGLAQGALLAWALRGQGLLVRPLLRSTPEVRTVLRRALPALTGLAAYPVAIVIAGAVASQLAEASVTALYLADRLLRLPLGLFAVALSTAALPALSRAVAMGDGRGVVAPTVDAVRLAVTVTVPAAAGLAVLSLPICTVLFLHGAMTPGVVQQSAMSLVLLASGLPAVAVCRVTAQVFFARGQGGVPGLVSVVGWGLTWIFAETLAPRYGVAGVSGGLAAAMWLQVAFQLGLLARILGPASLRTIGTGALRDVGLASLMAGVVHFATAWSDEFAEGALGMLLLRVGGGISLGVALYSFSHIALRTREATALRALWRPHRPR